MTEGVTPIISSISDLAKARTLYREPIGGPPSIDEVFSTGFTVAGQEIGLHPHRHVQGMTCRPPFA